MPLAASGEAIVPHAAVSALCPTLTLHLCLREPPLAARFNDQNYLDLFTQPSNGKHPEHPITDELLRHCHVDDEGKPRPTRTLAKDFCAIAEQVVNNPSVDGFPRHVQYPKCCGAYCKTHTPQTLMLTYLAIEVALRKIATDQGPAASVSCRDMVVAAKA